MNSISFPRPCPTRWIWFQNDPKSTLMSHTSLQIYCFSQSKPTSYPVFITLELHFIYKRAIFIHRAHAYFI